MGKSKPISYQLWIGVLLGLMYVVFLNPYMDIRGFNAHDPAAYILRAISLWNGKGYGAQYANAFLPVTAHPIGLSLILVPVVGLFGVNFLVLKVFMVFISGFLSICLFQFFRYFLGGNKQALPVTLLMMASPVIFGLSHRILADIPLFVFVVLALWTLDRYLREPVPIISRLLFVAALTSSAAYLIKQTGLAVFFGGWLLACHPAFRKPHVFKKLIVYSAVGFVPILVWHAWSSTIPDDLWYWTTASWRDFIAKNPFDPSQGLISVSDFIVRMRHNIVWGMSNNIAMILIAPFYFLEGHMAGFILSLPITAWLLVQWLKSYLRNPSTLEGFVFFTLSLLVVKYLGMAARYNALAYPALLVYTLRGLQAFPEKIRSTVLHSFLIVSLGTTFAVAVDQWKNPYGSSTLEDYVSLSKRAKELFASDSQCAAPLMDHWQVLTGHQCFWSKEGPIPESLTANSKNYVVALAEGASRDLERFKDVERHALLGALRLTEAVERKPEAFKRVCSNETFSIYRVL